MTRNFPVYILNEIQFADMKKVATILNIPIYKYFWNETIDATYTKYGDLLNSTRKELTTIPIKLTDSKKVWATKIQVMNYDALRKFNEEKLAPLNQIVLRNLEFKRQMKDEFS
jgi:hypothetical protein